MVERASDEQEAPSRNQRPLAVRIARLITGPAEGPTVYYVVTAALAGIASLAATLRDRDVAETAARWLIVLTPTLLAIERQLPAHRARLRLIVRRSRVAAFLGTLLFLVAFVFPD